MRVQETAVQTDAIFTVPNALSMLRLVSIPVFIWLILGPGYYVVAAVVLGLGALTDFLDGYIARRLKQISRLGQLLDPIADRLSTLAVLVVFLIEGIFGWWFVALLLARDLVMTVTLARLRRIAITGLPVNFIGKAATACLLVAFPLLLLGQSSFPFAEVLHAAGWAVAIWGAGLYCYSAILYVRQARAILALAAQPVGE